MNSRITGQLPTKLLNVLQKGLPALLLTVGEDGFPLTAYTWIVALNSTTIRFGADHGSTTLANLEREGRASLQVIAQKNLLFLIKGTTYQVKPQIEAAPFKIAMLALETTEVKDQSWPGASVQPLAFEWMSERQEEMLAMENAVYDEMRTWND